MVGQDAIRRLHTPGHQSITVICWMPAAKHCTPYTHLLDGLQVGCGATMGNRNLWLRDTAWRRAAAWPLIHVFRLAGGGQQAAGLAYTGTPQLRGLIRRMTPRNSEKGSRELARQDVAQLFQITPIAEQDCGLVG
jgi:hypothetical protein